MGRPESNEDRISTLQRVLARLAAPDVTLAEANGLRLEMQQLLESPAPAAACDPSPMRAGSALVCYLRSAC